MPALVVGAVAAGLAATAPGTPSAAHRAPVAQTRPNIVVIESDDQTVESMRVMHDVNSLIGDGGATFRNSFVNYSLCCPSRATFLTGQYEHNHRVSATPAHRRVPALPGTSTATTTWPPGCTTPATTPP